MIFHGRNVVVQIEIHCLLTDILEIPVQQGRARVQVSHNAKTAGERGDGKYFQIGAMLGQNHHDFPGVANPEERIALTACCFRNDRENVMEQDDRIGRSSIVRY